ncbi:site-specific DNA-methyltransferase [Blastococcus sp. MG754426]|uniref:site-specific DNA-methyltransferase n=1 Tax=unclassified Blastococcus TaxID=2619396 RepID=UPI001EF11DF1|nr:MULTISPECIES: DNA methyltransferase [unclassified Blastococcus]MCF6506841.1 site-specific DNA-methyltransferase [Blastococcus sp. MG754426]MCF6511641.1 site-specific DNA-methyltransferase [Blastococcus sp. MG754427]
MSTIRNQRLKGQLELTWTNKDQRLLSHGEDTYEWTTPDDYRVSEVRLLHDIATVGETRKDAERAKDNLLIRGDALHALTSLKELPEFAAEYRGKVRLAYIDPPFNTGQMFEHYNDAVEHSVWLTQMRDRLTQIHELLADNGSLWLHLDDSEMAYCRVILDEVFGRQNYVGTVVWETDAGRRNDTDISTVQDYILVVAKDKSIWRKQRNLLPRTPEQEKRYRNPDNDPRGPWLQGADSTARSGSDALRYEVTLPSGRTVVPPKGVFWRFSRENFDRALAEDRVYFGKDGDGMPIVKRYLSEVQGGVVPRSLWLASEVGSNMTAKRDHLRKMFPDLPAFATPKPEGLLERVIHIATDPGDIVLDCFAGSGTTAAVAHKMGRRWVTSELSATNLADYTRPRLEKVVNNEDPRGITASIGWQGGGGFRVMEVGPSMFEADEDGGILLAEWATNGAFAEAVCAQLGYERLGAESRPFSGRKGRMRLAVVDGVAGDTEVDFLVSHLAEGERLTLVAKAATEDAQDRLRTLSPGSRLRTAPRDLLRVRSHGKAAR